MNVGAPGIYAGTMTNKVTQQENPVIAIIAETGDGRMSGQDGTYYRLSVATAGSNVSGSYVGYSQAVSFPNGSQSTSGSVSATVEPPGLNGSLTDRAGDTEALLLNFDSIYEVASTLATLAGSWTFSDNGLTLTATIQSDGTLSAIDSNSCTYNGAFGLIDSNFNIYSENYVRSCNGVNLTFTGLATYLPATGPAAPAEIKLLADDDAGDYLVADLQ